MTTAQIQKKILQQIQELPKDTLTQVVDFLQNLKEKKSKNPVVKNGIDYSLSTLDKNELSHLEEEFADYKKKYPHE